jgi:hypothetical protein
MCHHQTIGFYMALQSMDDAKHWRDRAAEIENGVDSFRS